MSTPHPDALPLAIEALQAQAEVDQLTATFYTMTRHGNPLDADEREVLEDLKARKLAAVRLRETALARAFPPPPSPYFVSGAVKGS